MTTNTPERHITFTCRDGLSLFCRDFGPQPPNATPVLCLPGLTRNSKDFIPLSQRYGNSRRFLCPDLRGRGLSEWDSEYNRYFPPTYVEDMWELLAFLGIEKVTIIGTSLGGLMAMIMASIRPEAVSGVILNDVGPEVNHEGLRRVYEYVGLLPKVDDWAETVRQVKKVYEIGLPDLDEDAWLEHAKRQYREDANGVPRLEYDPGIGKALREMGGVPVDLWTLFEGLRDVPTLALRGAISDILSQETFDRMGEVKPDLARAIIPNRGHVPLLDEPACIAAIDEFLARKSP
uniref:Pimeloyl-ACP methyl ester carboxylesterase n=1 Tax=Candidatus Kentrum sp. SD TaxID=2126332 RepID=A0A451BS19_9GAMM|nr:MAG: Pimeloyl-ACP methyl ester carboxylesterase [Candidatus Kentron sp. SD]VFK49320.1 MAG: Pimeloyl-ACP methyl ester carboxylesterase [Candidatus Kentron sp. SD]VFK81069.1 MAG: Pimeloyl-ACP methyl ester carboxylesterase [Candidatus Kentron sp. SD]